MHRMEHMEGQEASSPWGEPLRYGMTLAQVRTRLQPPDREASQGGETWWMYYRSATAIYLLRFVDGIFLQAFVTTQRELERRFRGLQPLQTESRGNTWRRQQCPLVACHWDGESVAVSS